MLFLSPNQYARLAITLVMLGAPLLSARADEVHGTDFVQETDNTPPTGSGKFGWDETPALGAYVGRVKSNSPGPGGDSGATPGDSFTPTPPDQNKVLGEGYYSGVSTATKATTADTSPRAGTSSAGQSVAVPMASTNAPKPRSIASTYSASTTQGAPLAPRPGGAPSTIDPPEWDHPQGDRGFFSPAPSNASRFPQLLADLEERAGFVEREKRTQEEELATRRAALRGKNRGTVRLLDSIQPPPGR